MMIDNNQNDATHALILADIAAFILGIAVVTCGLLFGRGHGVRGFIVAILGFIVGAIGLYFLRLHRELRKGSDEDV
jgi:hypothetical protein